jgi:cytochrome c6
MQKYIGLLFSIVVILVSACGGNENANSRASDSEPKEISGYQIYKTHCRQCHGVDGRMGLNGAKPIPDSELSLEERILHISNGKGAMQPYKGLLSEEKIKAVAEYTMTLGKE